MKILPVSAKNIAHAIAILARGGIVAHATETCYGFACDLTNPEAVHKLFALKQRPFNQPVSALFASIEEAKKYVEWNERAEELAKKYLPGPLTLILPIKKNSLPLVGEGLGMGGDNKQKQNTLGVRISSHPVAMELAEKFGLPLSTTSANVHGKPNTYSVKEILEQLSSSPVGARCIVPLPPQSILIIDSGPLPKNPPSTIVDLSSSKNKAQRKGSIELLLLED